MPWPLWVYSTKLVAEMVLIEVSIRGQLLPRVIFPFVIFTWLFFLLKGVRWIWIAAIGLSILSFVLGVISDHLEWQSAALGLFSLALLLLPVTRRYFSNPGAAIGAKP